MSCRSPRCRRQYFGDGGSFSSLQVALDCCQLAGLLQRIFSDLHHKGHKALGPTQEAQLLNYLKRTGIRAGLLINFNKKTPTEGIRRLVL
ncbi:MAG: GxxExxY protein [Opitutales bacterium]